MSTECSRAELETTISKAIATRLAGNEKFKQGDLKGALAQYWQVLFALKGLDSKMTTIYGPAPTPFGSDIPVKSEAIASIVELPAGPDEPEEAVNEAETDARHAVEQYKIVKEAILNCYVNSAAIHIKLKNYKRALECSLSAQKLDETNPKAMFREAQARIRLGEIAKGKHMLEELNKKQPDPAITVALKNLAAEIAAKEAKKMSEFRGMFDREKKMTTSNTKSAASEQSATPRADTASGIPPKSSESDTKKLDQAEQSDPSNGETGSAGSQATHEGGKAKQPTAEAQPRKEPRVYKTAKDAREAIESGEARSGSIVYLGEQGDEPSHESSTPGTA